MNDLIKNGPWYLIRGSGVTSLLLLTAVMALGIATSGRGRVGTLPRFATVALHRALSLMSIVFVGIHVVAAIMDSYARVRVTDVLIPFVGATHPLALGLGTLSLELTAAAIITSVARTRIGLRTWRVVHWMAYATYPTALAHSIAMGADVATTWFRVLALGSIITVLVATWWRCRVRTGADKPIGPDAQAPAVSGVVR